MERGNGAEGEIIATTLSDQLYQEPTLYYGDPLHLPNANSKEASQLRGEGGSVLHPNALPHHPAPVVEEVYRYGQNRARGPCPEIEKLRGGLEPSTCRHTKAARITKGG